jgi:uncharacterized protein (UPF0332 family)
MNEQNKKANILEEIDRANEALKVATLLFENGFFKDAISRLYYSLLYFVRGLLLTEGLESRSHEGALRLFGLHFVKKGLFKADDSHIFSKLMKYREEADYNPSYTFTCEDFIEFKQESDRLIQKIMVYLKANGYL